MGNGDFNKRVAVPRWLRRRLWLLLSSIEPLHHLFQPEGFPDLGGVATEPLAECRLVEMLISGPHKVSFLEQATGLRATAVNQVRAIGAARLHSSWERQVQ